MPFSAVQHPDEHIIFFAVGFETTAPATALAVLQVEQLGLKNFSLLVSHVRVVPAMEAMMESEGNRVQSFLAAGHVCCITGYRELEDFAEKYRVPVVVTGFEPIESAGGSECVTQLESGKSLVSDTYGRSVTRDGNESAQAIVDKIYETEDRDWCGMGIVPQGGYRLRKKFSEFDVLHRVADLCELPAPLLTVDRDEINDKCRAGEVLTGRLKPRDCSEFGLGCNPDHPLGSPMVSSKGACAAYFRYHKSVSG